MPDLARRVRGGTAALDARVGDRPGPDEGRSLSASRVDACRVTRARRSPKPSEPHSLPRLARAAAAAVGALVLSAGVFANWSVAAALGRAPAGDLPRTCPSASLLRATLHQRLDRPTVHVGRIESITSAGFGPAPAGARGRTTSEDERTCTYARRTVTPITVSFVSPVTPVEFTASRNALRKSVGVIALRGIGAPAWATRDGGLVSVLRGTLEVVISASGTSLAGLTALARELRR
jgi:hypothetical protein